MFFILNLIMNSRRCKSKWIKRKWEKTKEHSKKRAWGVWGGIFPLFYQSLKLKKFDILVAHGELIRDCFLAELLSAKAANNHLSGSRSCSSGLHHLWESGQGPQPQYKDCLKPALFLKRHSSSCQSSSQEG